MKKAVSLFILSIFLISCAKNNKEEKADETVIDSSKVTKTTIDSVETDNCVFDTNTYKFTKDALLKYRKDIKFKWNKKQKEAMTVFGNGDTLLLHIGGCDHFSYSATLLSSISFDDKKALTDRTKWLAKTFFTNGFDTKYDEFIANNKFEKNESFSTKNKDVYEITESDTTVTNKVFDGFDFEKNRKRTKIEISGYVN